MTIRIPLPSHHWSIYKARTSFGRCEFCGKYRYTVLAVWAEDTDGGYTYNWTCKYCLDKERRENMFT